MKNSLLFITILILVFGGSGNSLKAQPQYYNYNTLGTGNSYPFNQPGGKKVQFLYLPGDFNQPTLASAGDIISISFMINQALGPFVYSDLTIKLGQSTITAFSPSTWCTDSLFTVLYKASGTLTGTSGQWMTINFDSAFTYDPTKSLIVEVSQCGAPGATGFSLCQSTFSGSRRNWSAGGCPFAYQSQNGSIPHIGFTFGTICNAPPAPTNTTPALNQTVCSGNSTSLSASGIGTLSWYSEATGGIYLGSGSNFSTQNLYSDTIIYVQDSTCMASLNRTAISVTVNTLPTISSTPNNPICINATAFTLNNANFIGGTYSGPGVSGGVFSPNIAGAGNHYIKYTYTDGNNCTNIDSTIIQVDTLPFVEAGTDVSIIINGAGSTIGSPFVAGSFYQWTPSLGLNNDTIAMPLANPTDTTKYILAVTSGACTSRDSVWVKVIKTFALSGIITYDNVESTPLKGLKVYLKESGVIIDSTITNNSGQYIFPNVYNGIYTLTASSTITWGGVNSSDALVVQRNFAGLLATPLSGIRLSAANTNNDASGVVNSGDALLIKRRFSTLISSFPSGDWTFNPDTIHINSAAVTMNFKGLCFGDVNGTYVPTGAKGQASVEMNKVGTMIVNTNTVDIPVKITHMMSTGAISMVLTYPANVLDVISVSSAAENISGLVYSIKNGKIYLAWSSLQPFNVQANDVVFSIKANVLSTSSSIDLGVSSISEFTDVDANVIPQVSLYYPELLMPNGVSENTGNNISISNYPNPFTNSTILIYELPIEGQVFIGIYDVNGKLIRIATNENQTIGKHIIDLDGENLAEGLYHVQMIVSSGSKVIVGGSTLMKIK